MSTLKTERLEKHIRQLEAQQTLDRIQHNDDLATLNNHWGEKFDMIVGMFQEQIKVAGTLGELRKWFTEWTDDVNSIDADAPDADEKMADILQKHGFEFNVRPVNVSYNEVLSEYRGKRR